MTIDVQVLLLMRGNELMPITEWLRVVRECAVEGLAVRRDEADRAVIEYEDDDIAFMHLTVVEFADTDEIGELRLAAVSPVLNVVSVEVPRIGTAWEATATTISRVQGALNRWRYAARLAANTERLALFVLYDWNDAAITSQSSGRFRGHRRAVFEVAATGGAVSEGFGVYVDHDLVAISAFERAGSLCQEAFRHDC